MGPLLSTFKHFMSALRQQQGLLVSSKEWWNGANSLTQCRVSLCSLSLKYNSKATEHKPQKLRWSVFFFVNTNKKALFPSTKTTKTQKRKQKSGIKVKKMFRSRDIKKRTWLWTDITAATEYCLCTVCCVFKVIQRLRAANCCRWGKHVPLALIIASPTDWISLTDWYCELFANVALWECAAWDWSELSKWR